MVVASVVVVVLVVVLVHDVQSSHIRFFRCFPHSSMAKSHLPLNSLQDLQRVSFGKKQMSGKFSALTRSAARIHSVATSSSCFFLAYCSASNCLSTRSCCCVFHASARQFKSRSLDCFSCSWSWAFFSRRRLRFRVFDAFLRQSWQTAQREMLD